MRFMVILFLYLFASPLFAANEFKTQIHDIDMGQVNEEPLIFLTTGQVVKFPDGIKTDFTQLREAMRNKVWFAITVNDDREIIQMRKISAPPSSFLKVQDFSPTNEAYIPSILKNLDHARSFFYDARTTARKESQCYNRAHVWTYEWRKNRNLYSSKAWLFFTKRYIRKFKFEWWFHVAPMVHVVVNNSVKERVMDIKYAKGPLKLKQWTSIFMRDDADCPVVEKYTDQANYPESGSCFLMKSSMYYYQPVDLEQTELTGNLKSRWLGPEVKHAYKEAFEIEL